MFRITSKIKSPALSSQTCRFCSLQRVTVLRRRRLTPPLRRIDCVVSSTTAGDDTIAPCRGCRGRRLQCTVALYRLSQSANESFSWTKKTLKLTFVRQCQKCRPIISDIILSHSRAYRPTTTAVSAATHAYFCETDSGASYCSRHWLGRVCMQR